MANTEFERARLLEQEQQLDTLRPGGWIVVRVDGRGFGKLCKRYGFDKPNDRRALDLMNAAAVEVLKSFSDIVLAYGHSDEYSFVFHENTSLFERRSHKLATSVSSMFTAEYCTQWPAFFGDERGNALVRPLPTFDGRCVVYSTEEMRRDYLPWRQADCHINNLYNTTFWTMVLKGNMSNTDAEMDLKGTDAACKKSLLSSRFGIEYDEEPAMYRKGTVIYRDYRNDATGGGGNRVWSPLSMRKLAKEGKRKIKAKITIEHTDIIGGDFWIDKPFILGPRRC